MSSTQNFEKTHFKYYNDTTHKFTVWTFLSPSFSISELCFLFHQPSPRFLYASHVQPVLIATDFGSTSTISFLKTYFDRFAALSVFIYSSVIVADAINKYAPAIVL